MGTRTARQIRLTVRIAVTSAIIGGVYGGIIGHGDALDAVQGVVAGFTIGGSLASAENLFLNAPAGTWVRRMPLAALLALRAAIYVAFIVAGLEISEVAVQLLGGPPRTEGSFARGFRFSILAAFVANVAILVRRLIGPTLLALLSGRYRAAREEERAVLFLDLRGSTAIAERLGNVRFLEFLDRVIFSATEQITEARGTIYRYVGDEIIVTWPIRHGRIDGAAVACKPAIENAIAAHAADWDREFGAVPAFRAGLHAGAVVVSELGDIRREIVLLGDVMNTAARIADLARDRGHPYLVSEAVMTRATLPEGLEARSIGRVALRGKAGDIELFTVAPAEAAKPATGATFTGARAI